MPFYWVRILKLAASSTELTVVLSITTDLGDASYPHPLSLSLAAKRRIGDATTLELSWSGSQAVQTYKLPLRLKQDVYKILITAPDEIQGDARIFGCGTRFQLGERFSQELTRSIAGVELLEASKEAIASHVWDGGALLAMRIAKGLQPLQLTAASRVLELGTGVGLVGLAMAQRFPSTEIILTDLEAARSLVEQNIQHNKAHHCTFVMLDWERQDKAWTALDLIVMADVTYNSDYHDALFQTLHRLKQANPMALLLFASKYRHRDELAFIDRLTETYEAVTNERFRDTGEEDASRDVELSDVQILLLK